jgi:hypothetical protein
MDVTVKYFTYTVLNFTNLQGRCFYYPSFRDEETEIHSDRAIWIRAGFGTWANIIKCFGDSFTM